MREAQSVAFYYAECTMSQRHPEAECTQGGQGALPPGAAG
jgi:hypothetical protein